MTFQSGFNVLGTASVAFRESPSVRTRYCLRSAGASPLQGGSVKSVYTHRITRPSSILRCKVPSLCKSLVYHPIGSSPICIQGSRKESSLTFKQTTFSINPAIFGCSGLSPGPVPFFEFIFACVFGFGLVLLEGVLLFPPSDLRRFGSGMRTMMVEDVGYNHYPFRGR